MYMEIEIYALVYQLAAMNKKNLYSTLNYANFITLCRIFCLPFMVYIYETNSIDSVKKSVLLTSLFIILAFTDWLDGYIARKYGLQSAFGAFLDPVADKIMIVVSLLIVLDMGLIRYWIALIIVLRELIISALREWMARLGSHEKVSVKYIGKLKTTAQMLAIPMLLFAPVLENFNLYYYNIWKSLASYGIYIAVALTIISMLVYLKDAINKI